MTIVTNAPDKIGKYRITGVIGAGLSGVVFKAFDPSLQRVLAVKSLHRDVPPDARAARAFAGRLVEQAQAISRVNHPSIVTVHQIDEADGRAFIAMEHVAGLNLAQWLSVTPLPPQAALLQVMDQLLDALECAHHAGVRHGDLKLTNVIVTSAGLVKLTDFGLARAEGRSGLLAGVAPEYQTGRLIDQRVDIYAAGAILYRMLVGRDPYANALADTAADALGGTLRLPSTIAEAQRPPVFDAVVSRALKLDPGQRFSTASEFRDALRDATQVRVPEHGTRAVTIDSTGTAVASNAATIAPMLGEIAHEPMSGRRAAPSGKSVPTLTIAIPDSVLSMPSHDPWAHGGSAAGVPVDRRESVLASDLVANDDGYAAALQSQIERNRRAAAAAATAALTAAADSAAAEPPAVPYSRRAPPPSATIPTLMSFPNEVPVGTGTGIVISGPVAQSTSSLNPSLSSGAGDYAQTDHLDLPLAGDGVGIPAEALRRLTRVLSQHFGDMAPEILMRAAPRAGTIPELHTLLLAQAGASIDKKRLAKQLKAIAKLPL
ncbi:serine/threonine-protein kinase [Scleromatobacter humisilvae]|uniref:Serine/threonine protein kinase n=1 Tax=Scleromatobacter humisilvae TaxID=2897159 RepID=A0A9X1YRM7_9BURK|nr:serine/threonine-protein kinase [Scleromatobacter humisilvae]MCK9687456.1 serine/threonine protein kinase [Scleromatobacter humisilvae]